MVTDATDLPHEAIRAELTRLLALAGIDRDRVTLEDLRKVLAEYVQDTLLAAKLEFSKIRKDDHSPD
jgi:hypothetical protein